MKTGLKIAKYFIFIFVGILISGCNNTVEDFVKQSRPSNRDPAASDGSSTTSVGLNSPMSMKITPGKINSSASGVVVQGTVTTTDKQYSMGADMSVRLTISRTRVLPN